MKFKKQIPYIACVILCAAVVLIFGKAKFIRPLSISKGNYQCKFAVQPKYNQISLSKDNEKIWFGINETGYEFFAQNNEDNYSVISSTGDYDGANWSAGNIIPVKKGTLYGLLNREGKEIISPKYDEIDAFLLSNGKPACVAYKDNGSTLFDENGTVIFQIPYRLQYKALFDNGNFVIENAEGRFGIVDCTGAIILQPQYIFANVCQSSVIIQNTEKHFGVLDANGKTKIPFSYSAMSFDNDPLNGKSHLRYSAQEEHGHTLALLDESGKEIYSSDDFESMNSMGSDTSIFVRKNGKTGVVDLKGKQILPIQYEMITEQKVGKNELLFAVQNGANQLYMENGSKLTTKSYEGLWPAGQSELILAKNSGKYGFLDFTGKESISCQYDTASYCANGLIVASKQGKYGVLNKSGNTVVPFVFDYIQNYHNGFASVWNSGKMGLIDSKGHYVFEPQFENPIPQQASAIENAIKGELANTPAILKTNKNGTTDVVIPVKQNGKYGLFEVMRLSD